MSSGNIPTINITGATLPISWEKAVLAVYDKGIDVKTEYDKSTDPPSKDATVIVTIENPFEEPRIHKNFPGGPEELEVYRQEVVEGLHDHWINPEEDKWTYTYHERLFNYSPSEDLSNSKSHRPFIPVNQIQYIIDSLVETFYTRRAQAITWQPTCDPKTYDPPCLQRIWCRILEDENKNLILNMNTHWRSRDLYRAWFMNVYALTDLQRIIAEEISKKIDREVRVGRYVDISDSLHLYGSYLRNIEPEIKKMKEKPIFYENLMLDRPSGMNHYEFMIFLKENIAQRTWETTRPAFKMMTDEAKEKLAKDPDHYKKGKG